MRRPRRDAPTVTRSGDDTRTRLTRRYRTIKCASGPGGLRLSHAHSGANGTNGANADGGTATTAAAGPYGDGADGPLDTADAGPTVAIDPNASYSSITIGTTLQSNLPSGTVLRTPGAVHIGAMGVIPVGGGQGGGSFDAPAGQGLASTPSSSGQEGMLPAVLLGGAGGLAYAGGYAPRAAESLFLPGVAGGGGGSGDGSLNGGTSSAGYGGGTLVILAKGPITIDGAIYAGGGFGSGGDRGSGGGGGGVVVLASATSITVAGKIAATGGNGDGSDALYGAGPGGGGGGGIVHLVSPSITVTGTIDVSGGAAGTLTQGSPTGVGHGGGGGGGSGGKGGAGGYVNKTTFMAATAGDPGVVVQTKRDPTPYF